MNTSDVNNPTTEPRWSELFATIEAKFKASNIASEKWYLTTLSAITTTPELHLCGQLYLYLISQHAYSTTTARSELIRRMREALFKDIALVGLPKPAEALLSITKFMSEEDGECSFTREGWQCDDANHARGMDWLKSIYADNTAALFGLFKDHPDFGFWVADITYGLLLSDRQILDDVDTEMVVLPAVMGQDMPRMTYWHMRGTRRLGISKEDVQMVMECVRLVVEACGVTLKQVPSLDDVDKDL
ncbi:hypothetical protein N7497_000207 [Penicillium chrysogenum]|jgi:hypothetical protein|uniref:Carboxymuconolactone decarboxylase-like domain-containing protein n=1 Tax=Penicillium chrysogenum TaxID=5076 RepID=A0ABQ8X377_PENCH|nr:hypothetical protein N7505_002486 [Penicillium chrysogenum]KAJ5286414.1 hypothetical protein N7524_001720 [Penicillium chrysogenum]KAJ6167364.1 hypothetical protein N7497_000207 [Penicillium chrysogenum]